MVLSLSGVQVVRMAREIIDVSTRKRGLSVPIRYYSAILSPN